MQMKVLINGSSVSAGKPFWAHARASQPTWPYRLQEQLNFDMVNLAVAGAGSTYIHESTIAELSQRSYDLVLIMWTDFDRVDLKVARPADFSLLQYTSRTQGKKSFPEFETEFVLDTEFIQPNWIFSGDYYQAGSKHSNENVNRLFGFTRFVSPDVLMEQSLTRIISLQGVLKSMNIPYRFMFFKHPVGLNRFANLYKLIDQKNLIDDPHLFSLAHRNNCWDKSTGHPTAEGYSMYAHLLVDYLKDQKLV
jgi:hypothetical protein